MLRYHQLLCHRLLSGKPLLLQDWVDYTGPVPGIRVEDNQEGVGEGTKEAFRNRPGQGEGNEAGSRRKTAGRGRQGAVRC